MPLYRKRVKPSFSSQIHDNMKNTKIKLKNIPAFKQKHSSRRKINNLEGYDTVASPIYPELLLRTASEPMESAFANNDFEVVIDIKEDIPQIGDNELGIFAAEDGSSKLSKAKPITGNNISLQEIGCSDEKLQSPKTKLEVGNDSSETVLDSKTTKDENELIQLILDVSSDTKDEINCKNPKRKDVSENRKNHNVSQIHEPIPFKGGQLKKLDNDVIISLNSSRSSQISQNDAGGKKNEPIPFKGRQLKKLENDVIISLNSSRSSQISQNDAGGKKTLGKVLKDFNSSKNEDFCRLSQNSNVSINDPIMRDAYKKFMSKKEKFGRVETPTYLRHHEKLKWLQEQRNVCVYVYCDNCDKVRYLEDIMDPTELPKKWFCNNNKDPLFNQCDIPEEEFPLHVQEDWIENLYNAGSLVWGKVEGYPWWPGIVDDDPNTECYYWLDDELHTVPSYYHVTFFDKKEVSRAWLKPKYIKPFLKSKIDHKVLDTKLKSRIDSALKQAKEAAKMPLLERLRKFSFLSRFQHPITTPKKVPKIKVKKQKFMYSGKSKKNRKVKNKKIETVDLSDISLSDFDMSPLDNISLDLFEDI